MQLRRGLRHGEGWRHKTLEWARSTPAQETMRLKMQHL